MRKVKSLVVFFFLFVFLTPVEVPAEDNLEISITYGIEGKVQMGKGFPVTVKVSNKGDTVSGDLVFFSNPNYESVGNIVVPVEIPKGEATSIQVSLPGFSDNYFYSGPNNQRQSLVKFYENGWENGKEVELDGNTTKRPLIFPEQRLIIGVLSETPDSLNSLKTARYRSQPIEFINVSKDDLASESKGLEVFDVLMISNYQISNLSDQQIDALRDWVTSGGHIMFESNPLLEQHVGFNELILIEVEDQKSFSELHFLSSEKSEDLPNFDNVEISTGKLKENVEIVFADHSIPMVVNKDYGLGEITQFAFNIGSETLSKWDGYSTFWTEVLQKTVDKDMNGQQTYANEELSYRLGNIVETYPSSFIPVKTLVILFVIYLILIIPGLYFFLRKIDKREISWIIIPVVAIISSLAIFIVGAKDRIGGSQINNVSILSIDDKGYASGYGAFSLLTNSGGNYPITIKPNEFLAFPLYRYNGYDNPDISAVPMVEKGLNQTRISFSNVEYWSIRSAMGEINSIETGKLEADLWVENNKLKGTVTNNLLFDVDDAYLLSGSKAYPLGSVKAGETINVKSGIDTKNVQNIIGAPRSSVAKSAIPGFYNQNNYGGLTEPDSREKLVEWKKFGLLDSIMYFDIQPNSQKKPLLAAFTSEPITEISLEDKNLKEIHSLSVVTQGVDVELRSLSGSEFKLDQNAIIPEISIVSGSQSFIHHNGLSYGDNFVVVEQGEYQLTYQLPVEMGLNNIKINTMKLRHRTTEDTKYSIYNTNKEDFVPLADSQTTFKEDANDYISEDGKVVVKFEKSGISDSEITIPTLELEGEYE